jgi:hypothetical protein
MPSCGINCKIEPKIGNEKRPLLIRKTHKKCSNNNCDNMVSFYEHFKCYKCSEYNTIEFFYHHNKICMLTK